MPRNVRLNCAMPPTPLSTPPTQPKRPCCVVEGSGNCSISFWKHVSSIPYAKSLDQCVLFIVAKTALGHNQSRTSTLEQAERKAEQDVLRKSHVTRQASNCMCCNLCIKRHKGMPVYHPEHHSTAPIQKLVWTDAGVQSKLYSDRAGGEQAWHLRQGYNALRCRWDSNFLLTVTC